MRGLTDAEAVARLRLLALPGVGIDRFRRILDRFGSGVAALEAPETAFEAAAGPGSGPLRFHPGGVARAEEQVARCRRGGVTILAPDAPGYPRRLLEFSGPPPLLFAFGDLRADRPRRVAVVGSRRASAYGRRVARRLGRELAEAGCTVVSGMALGVDGEAHQGALEAGGVTLAVLGSGPDRPYPVAHMELHRRIAASGGILSEHPPGTLALPHHFPRRNRILAMLSEAVVVVQAARRSGALVTAREALDSGAQVLAVPGSVEDPLSSGTFGLLADGAAPVASAADVLHAMGWPPPPSAGGAPGRPAGLGPVEGTIWELLGAVPRAVEELAAATGLAPVRVVTALGVLEVGGWAVASGGGRFLRGPGGCER